MRVDNKTRCWPKFKHKRIHQGSRLQSKRCAEMEINLVNACPGCNIVNAQLDLGSLHSTQSHYYDYLQVSIHRHIRSFVLPLTNKSRLIFDICQATASALDNCHLIKRFLLGSSTQGKRHLGWPSTQSYWTSSKKTFGAAGWPVGAFGSFWKEAREAYRSRARNPPVSNQSFARTQSPAIPGAAARPHPPDLKKDGNVVG